MPAAVACAVRVGDIERLAPSVSLSHALARPKSSTLTVPSGRSLMLAGLRSRWTIPCSCAASRASAICSAIAVASSIGIGPRLMRSERSSPSTNSMTRNVATDLSFRAEASPGDAPPTLSFRAKASPGDAPPTLSFRAKASPGDAEVEESGGWLPERGCPEPPPRSLGSLRSLGMTEEGDVEPLGMTGSVTTVSSPYNVAMLGWLRLASTLASRSNLAIRSGSLANSSGRTLSATSRPSFSSSARHTSPIPPAPRAAITL